MMGLVMFSLLGLSLICAVTFASIDEWRHTARRLHRVMTSSTQNLYVYEYSSKIPKSLTYINNKDTEGVVCLNDYTLYYLGHNPAPEYNFSGKTGSILLCDKVEKEPEKYPAVCIINTPNKPANISNKVLCRLWTTGYLDANMCDVEIREFILNEIKANVLQHPDYQLYRRMSTYPGDTTVMEQAHAKVNQYIALVKKNMYNMNDLHFDIVTETDNITNDYELHIVPHTYFAGYVTQMVE